MSSIGMGMKQEVWIGGPQKSPNYRRWYWVRGIKSEVYPRERGIKRKVDDNYDPSIPEWLDENYPRNFGYDDAHVNVLEEALPILTNNRNKRNRRASECRSYNYEDSTTLAPTIFRIYVFYRVKGHVITRCP